MFCGNAAGKLLPPMVVYKAKFVHDGWVNGGPKGSVFDCTDSGLFDGRTFKKWFMKVFIPNLKGDGPFAVIGNNLGSYFSDESYQHLLRKKHLFYHFGAEIHAPVPTIGLRSFWANEKKLEKPFE